MSVPLLYATKRSTLATEEGSTLVQRRSILLAWGLSLVCWLGSAAPAFADDTTHLESWRERAHESDFAQRIAGVYLIRHQTDDGRPSSFRLISLTPAGNWASTNSNQDAIFNLPGDSTQSGTFLPEDLDSPGASTQDSPFLLEDLFELFTPLLNPSRFSDQHGVWARSGWREITAEVVDFNLDALTGVHTDIVRVRYVVRFSKDLQSITGTQRGRVFPLDQDPLDLEAVPSVEFGSIFSGRRVTVEAE